ncbi:Processing alpha glucosidase I [Coemansia asiatica]|uniref:Mannosyl-oligosaccharide glucosidase n=1 Tax=Coemansia asiatica TaxID=1052880 RepID=A0A9W7XJ18_9FUNG|nr:Processing alpha glucosidase I [Coemansia asiatica]
MRLVGAISALFVVSTSATRGDEQLSQSQLDSELLWGTYRPNLYFGTRPRLPNSLLSGLMWFGLDETNWQNIRHSCELGDNLSEYGYQRHNGRDFGEQMLRDSDHGIEIKSEFVKVAGKNGGSWAVRFSGQTTESNEEGAALVYYFGLEGNGAIAMNVGKGSAKIVGKTDDLGLFSIRIVPSAKNKFPVVAKQLQKIPELSSVGKKISGIAVSAPKTEVWRAKDIFQREMFLSARKRVGFISNHVGADSPMAGSVLFSLDNDGLKKRDRNLFFTQMIVHGKFSFDVIFECEDKNASISRNDIDFLVKSRRTGFDHRFEATFGLRGKGFSEKQVDMARDAVSSLIGGIGYFHGSGLLSKDPKPEYGIDQVISEPELSEPYSLFATTPSRPFFPRGFLWDEGFHQLVLGQWDSNMCMEIIQSWFKTMDASGWIAREQILGSEARSKVPPEFQVQYPNFANPPTLLFAVEKIAEVYRFMDHSKISSDKLHGLDLQDSGENGCEMKDDDIDLLQKQDEKAVTDSSDTTMRKTLDELAENAQRLLDYFQRTQIGGSAIGKSLAERGYRWRGRTMDHTLTSGIDDYPRARPPSTDELHVDLYAWVTYMISVNAKLALLSDDAERLSEMETQLECHLKALNDIHWNEQERMFCDVTVQMRDDFDELEDDEDSAYEHVFVCHRGYVSLMPMLLGLVPHDSDKLGHILDMIEDPDELWTDYGVRSLSKSDQYYGKDENYWRGPIWLNINYLVLSSLHRNYVSVEGPHKKQSQRIYTKLRENLINNVFAQYEHSRFFWEQYNPETGVGQRTHPFTGWTTLIVPIMAEKY